MTRNCGVCGRTYTAKDPRSRYCGDACRKRQIRGTEVRVEVPVTGESLALVTVTKAALEDADKLDSVHGQLAMTIVTTIAAGGDTASGLASLSKELRAVMTEALGNVKVTGDEMDQLKSKRQAKRAG